MRCNSIVGLKYTHEDSHRNVFKLTASKKISFHSFSFHV